MKMMMKIRQGLGFSVLTGKCFVVHFSSSSNSIPKLINSSSSLARIVLNGREHFFAICEFENIFQNEFPLPTCNIFIIEQRSRAGGEGNARNDVQPSSGCLASQRTSKLFMFGKL